MNKQTNSREWIDRYLKGQLSDEEVVEFEERLIDDIQLQHELETELALMEAIKLDSETGANVTELKNSVTNVNQWSSMAIAASVLLAIVSTLFYWRTSVETGHLQQQLAELRAPRTSVLNVLVNTKRANNKSNPVAIVQKPGEHAEIILDIELPAGFPGLDSIGFELRSNKPEADLAWTATGPNPNRIKVALNSELIPSGMIELHTLDPSGKLKEEIYILEFREP